MDKNEINNIIEKLIQEGELVVSSNTHQGMYGPYINGAEYELWVTKCVDLIENYFKIHPKID